MAKQINFEVQVMQGGRWTIHARFASTGRDEAIEEAKQIESSGIGSVRVLRDVYDSENGTSNEFTVYKSGSEGSGASHTDGMDDGYGGSDDDWMRGYDDGEDDDDFAMSDDAWMRGGNDDDDDDDDEPARAKKPKRKNLKKDKGGGDTGFTGLLIKLMFVVLLAIGLAATTVAVLSPYIEGLNFFGTRLTGIAKENALIMTFLITFAAASIMLASVLLKNTNLRTGKRRAPVRRRAIRRPAAKAPQQPQPVQQTEQQSLPAIPVAQPEQGAETTPLTHSSETDEMGRFREEVADASYSVGDAAGDEDGEQGSDEDNATKRGVVLDAEDHPMVGESSDSGLTPHGEKQKQYMMQFIDKAMSVTGKEQKSMSNFDKFGVSLFLAGACETLGQKQELDEDSVGKIMADSVQTMGFKRSHANTFADKYDEYLVQDATYMQMFQAGRNTMATYLSDETRIEQNTTTALSEWNKPKSKESEAGPVTVLFTDIAGSTAMTQNLGDAGAQHVVRAHNRVVREALTMWNGKEVKHTGDGIMASFVKTSDSLDAAMQMQRETAEYTEQNEDKPLHLKIGINAGEPIAEDNDLFGSTVQMSARIVDKAQADEIFVSEIVRGICAGKNYKFTNRGTYPMKGFDTDPVLYEVVWHE